MVIDRFGDDSGLSLIFSCESCVGCATPSEDGTWRMRPLTDADERMGNGHPPAPASFVTPKRASPEDIPYAKHPLTNAMRT